MRLWADIGKIDAEQRRVWGWASVIEVDGARVVDTQGDVISQPVLRKAADEFLGDRTGGFMHLTDGSDRPMKVWDVTDSVVIDTDVGRALVSEITGQPYAGPVAKAGWWIGGRGGMARRAVTVDRSGPMQ